MVLATDGTKSFVLFIYGDITWGKAGIGFDAGDGVRSYMLPGSLDESTQEVEESSNVGVEGVYMYRVDQKEVIDPGGRFEVLRVLYKKLSDNPAKDHSPLIKPWQ